MSPLPQEGTVLDRIDAISNGRDDSDFGELCEIVDELTPLLRAWDDAQDALAEAEENEGHDEQERCFDTLQVAERALLAALRGTSTTPRGTP